MSLLKKQTAVSPFRGMPVDDTNNSTSVTSQTGETVQLYYYNAGVLTADAGQAAGVVVVGQLTYNNIRNALGSFLGSSLDTSLSFTSTALTAEVGEAIVSPQFVENLDESKGSTRAAAIGALLTTNGQYYVDYVNGVIYAKKASTQSTLTSTAYKYPASAGAGSVAVTSIVPGTGATNLGKAEDAVHTSGDVGVMALARRSDTAASSSTTDGDYSTLNTGSLGHLWTQEGFAAVAEDNTNGVIASAIKPLATSTYSWTLFQNLGADITKNVKASAGNVKSLYCHNINGAARYIQIHNTATTPGGGAVPAYTFLVPNGGAIILDGAWFGENGANFTTGIAFAFSTTEGTYTAGVAADQVTQIMYK